MRYLIDTDICIYIMKHVPNVIKEFAAKMKDGVAISAITLAELEYGACKSRYNELNKNKLIELLTYVEVLPFDGSIAANYGAIRSDLERKETPIGPMDVLIAAHAKSIGLTIVTNNMREYMRVDGLQIENWAE